MFDWLRKLFIGTPSAETKPEIVEATKPVVVDLPVIEENKDPVKKNTRQPRKPSTSKAMQNAKSLSRKKPNK